MTPEELRQYWNTLRDARQKELMAKWATDPKAAFLEANQLSALNFLLNVQLDTFVAQG